MIRDINESGPTNGSELAVNHRVVAAAAAGAQDAWDQIVDAYAGLVWAVPLRHELDQLEAAHVSQLTWMRLSDRLGDVDSEALGDWLQRTAERECSRVIRLSAVSRETEAQIA
jgi:hypothetical protein